MRTDNSTVEPRIPDMVISLLELLRHGNLAVVVEDNVKLRIGSPYRKYTRLESNKINIVCLKTVGKNKLQRKGFA